ncbi:hypothetical protein LPMP_210390 [Leishmania panamensis]|uniref:Uncharacterized protein n=1 Tax=Leishmania panamensis TaxID=5679 RepID=A0A088RQK2_LEIPA|nr:hypothetical protein LPMP_210390 [Leishmania panamensis]AIN98120.1 hypothetical protein LPMP_210390 [Leishmania panamensis]
MSSNTEQYWRRQLAQTEAEYEQIIQGLRDEVERQQRRCCELVHEQAMQRATAAASIRDFCQQYVTSAKQQQQQRVWSGTTATRMPQSAKKDVDSVPLPVLFAFLHEYSHGLLQLLENSRKRPRPDTQLSPLHHRLRQRMLARHWRTGREDELMDEWCSGEDGNGSGVAASSMPLLSASSSPTWPAVLPRYADPEGRQQMAPASGSSSPDGGGSTYPRRSGDGTVSSGVTTTTLSADGTAVPMGKASTATDGDATHGCGGPVMAASVFGLPSLLPR